MSHWTCQRVSGGAKCGHRNPGRKRKCEECGKAKPQRRRPSHLEALDLDYEHYVERNGGDFCGVCGRPRREGDPKLHRDHDHLTGRPRGVLCFRCNSALRSYMTLTWLRAAVTYLERHHDN